MQGAVDGGSVGDGDNDLLTAGGSGVYLAYWQWHSYPLTSTLFHRGGRMLSHSGVLSRETPKSLFL